MTEQTEPSDEVQAVVAIIEQLSQDRRAVALDYACALLAWQHGLREQPGPR